MADVASSYFSVCLGLARAVLAMLCPFFYSLDEWCSLPCCAQKHLFLKRPGMISALCVYTAN